MARQTRFVPGPQIISAAAAVAVIEAGGWLYFNHKPLHPGWTSSMTIHSITCFARRGMIRLAIERKDL